MLFIVMDDGSERGFHHLGERLIEKEEIPIHEIVSIQADGDELEHIYKKYPNLTPINQRVALFYGDIARTIFMNFGL